MSRQKPLQPEDFPVQAKKKAIIKQDGKQIAEAASEETAEEVAERLNADEHRSEEDRWG